MLARSFLTQSSSKLLVKRTGIKARSRSILGRIRPLVWSYLSLSDENFTLLNLNISEASWPMLISFMCSIIGERLHKVLGQTGSKLWFHGNRKPPLTYNGENDVSTFSRLFLVRSFLYLQVTRICIKSRTSSNFGQIGPLTTELAALEV